MTREIDWPMTVGTLLLAAFLGWTVLLMYQPVSHAPAPGGWARVAQIVHQLRAGPAERFAPGRRP